MKFKDEYMCKIVSLIELFVFGLGFIFTIANNYALKERIRVLENEMVILYGNQKKNSNDLNELMKRERVLESSIDFYILGGVDKR